jgi:SOS response regulatory protein OraA/RecX
MDYEEDLKLAMTYLEKKDASVEQLNKLAARLRNHAGNLTFGADYSVTVNRLKLQALQLAEQAKRMQASLLDDVQRATNLLNDRRLADALEAAPSSISRIRAGYLTVGATLIVRIHELTGWSVRQIKSRLNLPCLPSLVTYKKVPSE